MSDPFDYQKASADFKRYLPLKLLTLLWFLVVFTVALYGIAATWNEWWPLNRLPIKDLATAKPALYSFFSGALGAATYSFRGFYQAVGPQSDTNPRYRYDPNWTLWYVARPLLGGVLGVFVFALLRAGAGALGAVPAPTPTAAAVHSSAAYLAGFASTEVMHWLTVSAQRLFSTQDTIRRDSSQDTDSSRGTTDG